MELDLFFPKLNLCVEIQGPLHTSSPEAINRDYFKKICCEREGIQVAYIYTDNSFIKNTCLNNVLNLLQLHPPTTPMKKK